MGINIFCHNKNDAGIKPVYLLLNAIGVVFSLPNGDQIPVHLENYERNRPLWEILSSRMAEPLEDEDEVSFFTGEVSARLIQQKLLFKLSDLRKIQTTDDGFIELNVWFNQFIYMEKEVINPFTGEKTSLRYKHYVPFKFIDTDIHVGPRSFRKWNHPEVENYFSDKVIPKMKSMFFEMNKGFHELAMTFLELKSSILDDWTSHLNYSDLSNCEGWEYSSDGLFLSNRMMIQSYWLKKGLDIKGNCPDFEKHTQISVDDSYERQPDWKVKRYSMLQLKELYEFVKGPSGTIPEKADVMVKILDYLAIWEDVLYKGHFLEKPVCSPKIFKPKEDWTDLASKVLTGLRAVEETTIKID